MVKLAAGHMNGVIKAEAASWLRGDDPPEKWEPKAKQEFEKRKNGKSQEK